MLGPAVAHEDVAATRPLAAMPLIMDRLETVIERFLMVRLKVVNICDHL